MSRDDTFSDDFDDILNEILPGDLETVAEKVTDSDAEGWLSTNYTFARQVSEGTRRDVAHSTIKALSEELGVSSNTRTFAETLFEQIDTTTDAMHIVELYAGAALYCAGKITGEAISPDEFDDAGDELLTKKALLRRTKLIANELGLDISAFTDASQYVDRYCDDIDLDDEIRNRALDIIEICNDAGLNSGKSPTGWAAAAVYNASLELGNRVTQSDVAKVANVTEVTIRNRYQEQRDYITAHESSATNPRETVDRIQERLDLNETIASEAKSLLDAGENAGLHISGNRWGVAAISVTSKAHNAEIGYRSLTSYTTVGSEEIRECEQQLKSTHN